MATFRSKFQIAGLIPTKENKYRLLLSNPLLLEYGINQDIRSFSWFRRWRTQKQVEYGSGNCGKPLPKRIELCKGCPSKCLEKGYGEPIKKPKRRFLIFRRKEPIIVKQKPSNCEVVEVPKVKLTLWEQIFGPDPRRSWPDPCTCRLAYQKRKKCQVEDPRLRDSRYTATGGDVLIYTETLKSCGRSCMEPHPKPPPPYKMPKAVLCRLLVEASKKIPANCAAAGLQSDDNCKEDYVATKPPRIPFDEMRPPEKRRKIFNYREGVRPEDVSKPSGKSACSVERSESLKDSNAKSDSHQDEKKVGDIVKSEEKDCKQTIPKRSRIEQLKMLVQRKKCV